MSQQSRRHDPYPWTWEIPLAVAVVILMVLVCGVHLGRGIANVLAGAGWAGRPRVGGGPVQPDPFTAYHVLLPSAAGPMLPEVSTAEPPAR